MYVSGMYVYLYACMLVCFFVSMFACLYVCSNQVCMHVFVYKAEKNGHNMLQKYKSMENMLTHNVLWHID